MDKRIGIPIQTNKKGKKKVKENKLNIDVFSIEFDEGLSIQSSNTKPKTEGGSNDFEFEDLFHSRELEISTDAKNTEILKDSSESAINPSPNIQELNPHRSNVTLEDFELLKLVGRGAYGKVYQARKKDTNEIFAVKVLRKDCLVKTDNVGYTQTEKNIMKKIHHPFIVHLHYAFQNDRRVYMVMDFVNGGQLFYHLRDQAMFSENIVKFYIAELVLALEFLHSNNIVHRDLKPENILLDKNGHVQLTDFGFAREVLDDTRCHTICGTKEYMSPEMISGKPYGKEVDWWAVGVLIFEMCTGEPPFKAKNEQALYNKILKDKVRLPRYLTPDANSIIKEFMNRDETARLGSGEYGVSNIKKHSFFRGMNWRKLVNLEVDPPFKPNISKGDLDLSNFDAEFLTQGIIDSPADPITGSQEELFKNFSYVRTPDPNSPQLVTHSPKQLSSL